MEIKTDKEMVAVANSVGSLKTHLHMRQRMNPHHPKSHQEYEKIMVDLQFLEAEELIVKYVWPRRASLLMSPDEEIRKMIKHLKNVIGLPIEDMLNRIAFERLVLECRLEEVKALMNKGDE